MHRRVGTGLAVALVLAACGGGRPHVAPQPPKPLDEAALLHELPGGNVIVAGGSYDAMPKLMQSPLGAWFEHLVSQLGTESQGAWMRCFARFRGARFVGGLVLEGFTFRMRALTAGLSVHDIVGCAHEAGIPVAVDPDGKFATVTMTMKGRTTVSPYLELPGGLVYSVTRFAMGSLPDQPSRKELESELAQARQHSAADDAALLAIATHADHTRMVWFAGTAAATPLAGKLGEVYGTFDLAGGLRLDLTTQIVDAAVADGIMKSYLDLLKHPEQMPPALRAVFDAVSLRRTGDHLHLVVQLGDRDLANLLAVLQPSPSTSEMHEAMSKMSEFRAEMCACKDSTCAQQVSEDMTKWSQEFERRAQAPARPSEADARQMAVITKDLTACMAKAMSLGPPNTSSATP